MSLRETRVVDGCRSYYVKRKALGHEMALFLDNRGLDTDVHCSVWVNVGTLVPGDLTCTVDEEPAMVISVERGAYVFRLRLFRCHRGDVVEESYTNDSEANAPLYARSI